jgi:hypothetical protein
VYSEKHLMMDQRNCPKHVEFHSKNKFEKLVHLVGFIIRNLLVLLDPENNGITNIPTVVISLPNHTAKCPTKRA